MSEPGTSEQRGAGTPESSYEHPNSAPNPPATGFDNKVAVLAYLGLGLNVLFFSVLIAVAPERFEALTREDSWVEYLTAVCLFLAGGLLFGTAWRERSLFRRGVYLLGGVALLFAAGEEVSWGQRIFGFATPDFFLSWNQQQEFTVHNSANGAFDIIYLNGTLLLCMATSAAFFCRKDRLCGIPLPSILLMLGFLLMLSFGSGGNLKDFTGLDFSEYIYGIRQSFGLIVIEEKALLLLLLTFALISRQVALAVAATATLALVLALSYVNYHNVNGNVDLGRLYEAREYLFGVGCLFYSLELALAQRRAAARAPAPFPGLKLSGRPVPLWLLTCSLLIAASIGLIVFQYFNATPGTAATAADTNARNVPALTAAEARAEYAALVSGEPLIRSDFDLYLSENRLVYVREPCARADTEATFFLHLYPVEVDDLPAPRPQSGFDNRDFSFFDWRGEIRGGIFDGKCMVAVALPEYPIDRVRTGQYVPVDGGGYNNLWEVEFPWKESE